VRHNVEDLKRRLDVQRARVQLSHLPGTRI
jgi:hypothetical protein